MHGLRTDVTICNLAAYALRWRACNGMFAGAVYILILTVMSFALASYMANHIRSRRSLVVNAPMLHRSNLMNSLEWILSEGDARSKMTASWELIELEDNPQVQEIK